MEHTYYVAGIPYSDELFHFGIKGQKWGIRRFQNPDGSYTQEGKERYGAKNDKQAEKFAKYQEKEYLKTEALYSARGKALQNKINKIERKGNKITNPEKLNEIARKLEENKQALVRNKNTSEKVLSAIKDMKVSDMRKEKVIRGSVKAGSALLALASLPVGVVTMGPSIALAEAAYTLGSDALAYASIAGMAGSFGLGASGAIYNATAAGKRSRDFVNRNRKKRA